jgi:hypothetical protein
MKDLENTWARRGIKKILPDEELRDEFFHIYDQCRTRGEDSFKIEEKLIEAGWFKKLVDSRKKPASVTEEEFSRRATYSFITVLCLLDDRLSAMCVDEENNEREFFDEPFVSWNKISSEEWKKLTVMVMGIYLTTKEFHNP